MESHLPQYYDIIFKRVLVSIINQLKAFHQKNISPLLCNNHVDEVDSQMLMLMISWDCAGLPTQDQLSRPLMGSWSDYVSNWSFHVWTKCNLSPDIFVTYLKTSWKTFHVVWKIAFKRTTGRSVNFLNVMLEEYKQKSNLQGQRMDKS